MTNQQSKIKNKTKVQRVIKEPQRKVQWDRAGIDKKLSEEYEDKIIAHLKEEWNKIGRGAKREEIIRRTKETGMKMGKVVLSLLLIGGILSIGAIAPNVFGAIGRSNKYHGFFGKKEFLKTKKYLLKQGYIKLIPTKDYGVYNLTLTDKGRQKVLLEETKRTMMRRDIEKWDGLWRVVLFDIAEKNKGVREAFRKQLRLMGLHQLQDSVLISPFPICELIAAMSQILGITDCVRCIESRDIGEDEEFKDIFHIKK